MARPVGEQGSAPVLVSDWDPDPAQFNDSEWIGGVYTFDGETIYAALHNEYRGDTHGADRPGQCPSGERLTCLDTSLTMAISTDGGATYRDILPAPNHLIATLPYTFDDEGVPSGLRQPSNIILGPDDLFYVFSQYQRLPERGAMGVCRAHRRLVRSGIVAFLGRLLLQRAVRFHPLLVAPRRTPVRHSHGRRGGLPAT